MKTPIILSQFSFWALAFCLILPGYLSAQDFSQPGGDTTSNFTDRNALQLPTVNMTSDDRRTEQMSGFEPFHRRHSKSTGVGPIFNSRSCGDCHISNGKGINKFNSPVRGSSLLIKVAERRRLNEDGSPIDVQGIGEQIRDHANSGAYKFDYNIRLRYELIEGNYPDGDSYKLRKPILGFVLPDGRTHRKVGFSLRATPSIIGPGLLESISEETILGFSDPDDANQDGIKGVPQYTGSRRTGGIALGRFGWKASHPTLEQQNAAASFFDMGRTNVLFNENPNRLELSEDELHLITFYLALGGVPPTTDQTDPNVIRGKELFQTVNCHGCHRFNIVTSDSAEHPELRSQTIHPFTDLLLHDMGHGLADRRPERNATRKMWRTPPLWGIGKLGTIFDEEHPAQGARRIRYLHDGRARTLEEAILWHAGEAEQSINAFKALSREDRRNLIKFLKSL